MNIKIKGIQVILTLKNTPDSEIHLTTLVSFIFGPVILAAISTLVIVAILKSFGITC